MSACSSTCPDGSDKVLLRWSDTPNSPSREEIVEILETDPDEAVIRSALKVSERTEVLLIGKDYSEMGVVRSCRQQGNKFIVTIQMGPAAEPFQRGSQVDPGVLAIDDFLTEEQEAQILNDLDEELREQERRAPDKRSRATGSLLDNTLRLQKWWHFTLRSSTELVPAGVAQFVARCRTAAGTCALPRFDIHPADPGVYRTNKAAWHTAVDLPFA